MTAITCIEAINSALKQFGEYSYYDKGADEVMSVSEFVSQFKQMPATDTAAILVEVSRFEHGAPFVSSILCGLQNMPNAYFDELMAHPELEDNF